MSLFRPCLFTFLAVLFLIPCKIANGKSVSEILDWPPVFERLIGDPDVVVKDKSVFRKDIVWIRPLDKVIVYRAGLCDEQVERILIDYFLEKVWQAYLSPATRTSIELKYDMKEIVPVTREVFYQIGRNRLAGRKTGCAVHDAWWSVRMGCQLTPDKDHLLCFNNLSWAEKNGIPHGHFCFALRKRGGDPDGDMIFDFRAPWKLDRRAGATDMFDENIRLDSFHENYYDWLSTQTAVRHCDIFAIFVPVSCEQATLLKAYRGQINKAAKYTLFKGNCASLGLQFINRLLPLDERVSRENSIMDYPARKISLATGSFGDTVAEVEISSSTLERGREFTHNNTTLSADPGRRECDVFLQLQQVAAIN